SGSRVNAALTSCETRAASWRVERAGIAPARRWEIHRKSVPSAASIKATNAKRPSAIRQYRLFRHGTPNTVARPSGDIGRFISGAPHGENHIGFGGVGLDLLAQSLDQRIDASH